MTGASIIRGVKPEAVIEIDGRKFNVGGLVDKSSMATCAPSGSMPSRATRMRSSSLTTRWEEQKRGFPGNGSATARSAVAPSGVSLTLHSNRLRQAWRSRRQHLHEIYEGIPLLAKWLEIHNGSGKAVKLNTFIGEVLAVVEHESLVNEPNHWELPNIHIESDYAFHGDDRGPPMSRRTGSPTPSTRHRSTTSARPGDARIQVALGPDVTIEPDKTFESFRTFELVHDSTNRERKAWRCGECTARSPRG